MSGRTAIAVGWDEGAEAVPAKVEDYSSNPFTADYYLCGKEKGISNYENYHFMEPETQAYAVSLTRHLGLHSSDWVHDMGCSRGYLVKVLHSMGYLVSGHDISEWAIANCHPDVTGMVSNECAFNPNSVDWVHAKDVLEHIQDKDLEAMLPRLFGMARKGCFFICPLTAYWGGKYIYPADNMDQTHVIRYTLQAWMTMLVEASKKVSGDFSIHGSFHMSGLKRASVDYPYSTGFFTVRRFL